MSTKIIVNGTMFTFEEDGLQFDAVIENGRIVTVSDVREGKMKKPEDKYITNGSTAGTTALKALETAVMAEPRIQAWEVDGYQVAVYKSGAGYYAGCYCDDGPYTRISGYSSGPALILHWMYKTIIGISDDNDGEDDENGDQNIQDAIDDGRLTLGQYANMISKLASVGEEEPDELKILRETNETLTQRIEKAAIKYRELVTKYNNLVAAYNYAYAKLDNANKANAHMRWLLRKNNVAI
jgi:hypothetical protein